MNAVIQSPDIEIQVNDKLLSQLDEGIDDIEAGRILSVEDTFDLVTRIREEKRNARLKSEGIG